MPKKAVTRRKFLQTTAAAGAASFMPSMASQADAAQDPGTVPTRPFGKSGIDVSILSLGGMFDIANNHLMLRQCIRWGVTYWDTANSYGGGRSEKGFGKFFKKYPGERQKVFLVTKTGKRSPRGMTQLLNRSLRRLQTDVIDLYLVHGIRSIDEIHRNARKWAEKAKAEGKIRLFGFSTHSNMEACLSAAADLGWIDGIMMTYNYRLMHTPRMKAAVDACVRAGIGLTAMKTQGGGAVKTDSDAELKLAGRFMQKGFSDAQAKLKAVWANRDIACICSQMPNMSLLMANTAAAMDRTRLTANDMQLLNQLAVDTASGYCAGCSQLCESAIAEAVPIADIMRYLMYCNSYADRDRAVALFRQLPEDTRARLHRIDYTPAERVCPQRMAIAKLMHQAAEELA